MDKYIPSKYNDLTNDNKWLHRIANETAETNSLLKTLIELYVEDNPRKIKPVEKPTGGAFGGSTNSTLNDVFNKNE